MLVTIPIPCHPVRQSSFHWLSFVGTRCELRLMGTNCSVSLIPDNRLQHFMGSEVPDEVSLLLTLVYSSHTLYHLVCLYSCNTATCSGQYWTLPQELLCYIAESYILFSVSFPSTLPICLIVLMYSINWFEGIACETKLFAVPHSIHMTIMSLNLRVDSKRWHPESINPWNKHLVAISDVHARSYLWNVNTHMPVSEYVLIT